MVCVAVTRGGSGDLWRFASLNAASDHPLIQYGDAVCCTEEDVQRTFRASELAGLADRTGQPQLSQAIRSCVAGSPTRQDMEQLVERLWTQLRRAASEPPEDPAEVIRLVRKDRAAIRLAGASTYRLHPAERSPLQTRNQNMTEAATETKRPISREPKIAGTSVITFGKDKDGKDYGSENNPKRAGSAACNRFALYVSGSTVDQALEAGVTRADINWDAKQGFIVLS